MSLADHPRLARALLIAVALSGALLAARLFAPLWCGWDAAGWYRGDWKLQSALAEGLIAFEAADDLDRQRPRPQDRFAGEWALVTHQMIALGLFQLCLAHPEEKARLAPLITRAALKSFLPEMRGFGTRAWHGEDALASLDSAHGHAYLAYAAMALGAARLVDPDFPKAIAQRHDALIAAYERRLLESPTGLIETYPGKAYPTDVAAVAAAIALHGRATGADHSRVLHRWAERVRKVQLDSRSGFVVQCMGARDGRALDAPRGSGTGLAAYFAGFADRALASTLADGLLRHEATFAGFSGVREYAEGHIGKGDVDSGPVILGVSIAASGFALAPARAFGHRDAFERLYRTTDLFGMPVGRGGTLAFTAGGPFGNALLLAFLTSGLELAP